ncbi:nitrilase-related carbon-nitrogen hydrolase [Solilutibacter silvestris]|uniref:nitrilase-related carbon-nitrogen hydrolase n=1 Tax=Solilutibacter silvestris TaxID=1645665 RepID=UPI003D34F6C8
MKIRIAAVACTVAAPDSFEAFAQRIRTLLRVPLENGAQVIVLPEALALELVAMLPERERQDPAAAFASLQELRPAWMQLFSAIAIEHGVTIVAGSFPVRTHVGRYGSRCDVFSPDGRHVFQDKLHLTVGEKALGVIEPGDALKVFDIAGVSMAIALGHDCQFPLPVRAQCEAGARVLIVPARVDRHVDALRIRVGCMAWALENRCHVVLSVAAAESALFNTEAAVLAPTGDGFSCTGVLVSTSDGGDWTIADLDIAVDGRSVEQRRARYGPQGQRSQCGADDRSRQHVARVVQAEHHA